MAQGPHEGSKITRAFSVDGGCPPPAPCRKCSPVNACLLESIQPHPGQESSFCFQNLTFLPEKPGYFLVRELWSQGYGRNPDPVLGSLCDPEQSSLTSRIR